MVAKVISGKNIRGALNYNEQKVLQGTARCIQASGFIKNPDKLNFFEKLLHFTDLNERNTRTKTNTLHISLNFDMTETLSVEDLNRIASTYMDKIGFAEQPFLVYEHTDAAHPHIHIVTTIIQQNGKRIPIHYLGKNQSEKARREIELEFGLVKAESKTITQHELLRPADVQKAVYGKSETRRSIAGIVRTVTRSYKYTSLPELNAVLRQFNVVAYRGAENSRMFQKKGLQYSLLDDNGKHVGIPLKASSIYGKPTLAFLERQYKLNEILRRPHKESIRNSVEQVLQLPSTKTKQTFKAALTKIGIVAVFRMNAEGRTYGVTFLDNKTLSIFNGSDLGKGYSAAAILERLSVKEDTVKPYRPGYSNLPTPPTLPKDSELLPEKGLTANTVIADLISVEDVDHSSPEVALRLRGRKKRRKGRRL